MIINVTLPSDGTTADVQDYNSVITTMLGIINGQLDDDNISGLSGSKITSNTLPISALDATAKLGYITGLNAPNSVTNNGAHSFDVVFNGVDYSSILTPGMRVKFTRTVAAPTQCTKLNGSSQYWVKTTPNKMTFTDDFAAKIRVKLTAYPAVGSVGVLAACSTVSNGWLIWVDATGAVVVNGRNGGAGNFSRVTSYQSLPLNKWVDISVQLDMSSFTATSTTSYIMFDDVDVPAFVSRSGTNPTAITAAGDLTVGSGDGGLYLAGKVAQLAIFNAKVTQATMRSYSGQAFSGTETSLASAYSFNGNANDLNTTTPNNLSVGGGSVVATEADSPFALDGREVPTGTDEFGIVMQSVFSTNTTVTIQTPDGSMLPTSGGISSIAYSGLKVPSKFPASRGRWTVLALYKLSSGNISIGSVGAWAISVANRLTVPIGEFILGYEGNLREDSTVSGTRSLFVQMASSLPTNSLYNQELTGRLVENSSTFVIGIISRQTRTPVKLTSQTNYSMYGAVDSASGAEVWSVGADQGALAMFAEPAHL